MHNETNCPRCHGVLRDTVMNNQQGESLSVQICGECNGMFLDVRELNKIENNITLLVEEIKNIPDEEQQGAELWCPRCRKSRMAKRVHRRDADVVMDICPVCNGVWLDGGELEAIKTEDILSLVKNALAGTIGQKTRGFHEGGA